MIHQFRWEIRCGDRSLSYSIRREYILAVHSHVTQTLRNPDGASRQTYTSGYSANVLHLYRTLFLSRFDEKRQHWELTTW